MNCLFSHFIEPVPTIATTQSAKAAITAMKTTTATTTITTITSTITTTSTTTATLTTTTAMKTKIAAATKKQQLGKTLLLCLISLQV